MAIKRAKTGAATALVLLATVSLTMTSDPPADPVLGASGELLRRAMGTSLQSFFLLGAFGGFLLLGGLVAMVVRAYLEGTRIDWLAILARRMWQTALASLILAFFCLLLYCHKPAAGHASPPIFTQPAKTPGITLSPLSAKGSTTTSAALSFLLAGAGLLVGAGGFYLALRARAKRGMTASQPLESNCLTAVRRRLELGDQVRDAIIDCYAEMCRIFSRGSTARTQSLTAREFASLLRTRGAGEPEILALTSVFEKARYSVEPCDERDRSHAVTALRVLESRYGIPEPDPS